MVIRPDIITIQKLQCAVRQDLAGIAYEVDHQIEFFGRQAHLFATLSGGMCFQIDAKVAILDHASRRFVLRRTP